MAPSAFRLNTGQEIPSVGLGTWQSPTGEVQSAVSYALKNGYRLIDCAYCYGNEDEVGRGLKDAFDSGISRADVFVMTKVWATYNTRVAENLDMSLKALGLTYVDMYLIHWPVLLNPNGNHDKLPTAGDGSRDVVHDWNHIEAWKQMEALVGTGKVKAIGVCNYSKKYLDELLAQAAIVPAINQIENHPSLPQNEIVGLCKEKGIHVVAYSPLGSTGSPLITADAVELVAQKKGVGAGTVLLSYHVARESTVLAKSTNPYRIKSNLEIIDLGKDERDILDKYSRQLEEQGEFKRYVYPPFGVDFGFPDRA